MHQRRADQGDGSEGDGRGGHHEQREGEVGHQATSFGGNAGHWCQWVGVPIGAWVTQVSP